MTEEEKQNHNKFHSVEKGCVMKLHKKFVRTQNNKVNYLLCQKCLTHNVLCCCCGWKWGWHYGTNSNSICWIYGTNKTYDKNNNKNQKNFKSDDTARIRKFLQNEKEII